jgi:hypothetical protein
VLRRRLGLLAVGAGVSLLKPRTTWAPLMATVALTVMILIGAGFRAA